MTMQTCDVPGGGGGVEVITPEPGIYPGVPATEYHAWNAASKSRIAVLAEKTPAHLDYILKHGSEPSDAKEFGDATHAALFEPDRFAAEYMVAGRCNAEFKSGERKGQRCPHSGIGMIEGQWRCGQHGGDAQEGVMSADEGEDIKGILEGIKSHGTAISLIRSPGWTEISLVWNDLNTDELCKCRIDRLVKLENFRASPNDKPFTGYGVVDLKTTVNAGQAGYRDFVRESLRRMYHLQSAMYLCGVMNVLKAPPDGVRFFLVAVDKTPPYLPCVYEVSRKLLGRGWMLMQRLLKQYAKCQRDGIWPGYAEGVVSLDEPDWMPPEDEGEDS